MRLKSNKLKILWPHFMTVPFHLPVSCHTTDRAAAILWHTKPMDRVVYYSNGSGRTTGGGGYYLSGWVVVFYSKLSLSPSPPAERHSGGLWRKFEPKVLKLLWVFMLPDTAASRF